MKISTPPPRLLVLGTMFTLLTAVLASAQPRPGIDRPIRVGMFKGVGTGGTLWHTNIHTSHTVMAQLLGNPAAANLGPDLVVPPAGFTFYSMPVAAGVQGPSGEECSSNGCGPTPEQLVAITALLDTLDVLVMSSSTRIDVRITDSAQRRVFERHWETKGYVSIHATVETAGLWSKQDSVQGTRFNNHPSEQTATIRRDSVHQLDSAWQYLNRGLFSNDVDTAFIEEWFFFTNTGAEIRAKPHLKPTTKLIENGLILGTAVTPMGDHPMSWYRQFPTGGRTFYTALGHRSNVWTGTRTFRRQVYNAILWAAKFDSLSNATISVRPDRNAARGTGSDFRVASRPGTLTVTTVQAGAHTVELRGIDGRRLAGRKGEGAERTYDFTGLRPGLYSVVMATATGRTYRLVTAP
jgi:type 1 glutamine amidotransferase